MAMRVDLAEDPATLRMSASLSLTPDDIVGKLLRIWGWASAQTTDGCFPGVQISAVDRKAACDGFALAMVDAGWLVDDGPKGFHFPRFEVWNSKSAKARLLDSRRKGRKPIRFASGKTSGSEPESTGKSSAVGCCASAVLPFPEPREGEDSSSAMEAHYAGDPALERELQKFLSSSRAKAREVFAVLREPKRETLRAWKAFEVGAGTAATRGAIQAYAHPDEVPTKIPAKSESALRREQEAQEFQKRLAAAQAEDERRAKEKK